MKLSRYGRENLKMTITTEPPLTDWEASFDGGQNWIAGTPEEDGQTWWLVAGPNVEQGSAVVVLARGSHPVMVRAIDNPEIIVRSATNVTVS